MKLNERNLVYYATCKSPVDKSGFLFKKGDRSAAYHKRWFVLKGNMLFYFDNEESREPVGVVLLEGCRVELCESTEEYAFAINFAYVKSRAYILAAESQSTMESWVKALSRANFEYIRIVVSELQKQLEDMRNGTNSYTIQTITEQTAGFHNSLQSLQTSDLHVCSVQKDNSCAKWNSLPNTISNGFIDSAWGKGSGATVCPRSDSDSSIQPPSLPLDSQLPSCGQDETCSSLNLNLRADSPVYHSFEKLHVFFGEEIVEMRAKWKEMPINSCDSECGLWSL